MAMMKNIKKENLLQRQDTLRRKRLGLLNKYGTVVLKRTHSDVEGEVSELLNTQHSKQDSSF